MATAEATAPGAHHEHDHDHPEWLAHHFETPEQQFDAGKLGMWLFLAQEVLFFSGLFVAYTVYRANHPEVFLGAHEFLNPVLGALNTVVLLASSLAIAWGVRAAQKNQQQTLMWMHVFTLACAGFFLGVKVVEYGYKFDEGLFWAGYEREYGHWATGLEINPDGHAQPKVHLTDKGIHTHLFSIMVWSFIVGAVVYGYGWVNRYSENKIRAWVFIGLGLTVMGMAGGIVVANGIQETENQKHAAHGAHGESAHESHVNPDMVDHNKLDLAVEEEEELIGKVPPGDEAATVEALEVGSEGDLMGESLEPPPSERPTVPITTEGRPVNAGNFFSIYFAMTGVHALHIIAGIIAISWIVARIARGDFGPHRYGPVEYTGLYWHLVDLVWIYLFPLLYLIR